MIWFIIGLVVSVIGVALAPWKITKQDRYGRPLDEQFRMAFVGVPIILIGLAVVFMNCFTVVPTRNLAVQTSFGKPVGTLSNGFHWVRPWSDVHTFDATIQTIKFSGEKDDNGDTISVRLANAATAQVEVSVQWQIDPSANITQLYLDYKEFDKIATNVVQRQLASAMNVAFEKYDPLLSLKMSGGSAGDGKTLSDLGKDVQAALEQALPAGIKVRSVLVPKIIFDDAIQAKINQFLAALAETQIAEQRQKTAEAQKTANDLLAKGNSSSGVLYQNCLDMVERLTRDGKTLPAAFTCGLPPTTVVPVK